VIIYVVIEYLKCPVCSEGVDVTSVTCTTCEIDIKGAFKPHWLTGLDSEQLEFLLTFVRCRGVLRDIEAILGISYPTVRNRVDQLVDAVEHLLGESQAAATPRDSRLAVLERLAGGEISPGRALTLLDALKHP
jgi:hypothetical protein